MLMGMIHSTIYMHTLVYQDNTNVHEIVQYCVNRVLDMVNHLSNTKEVLLNPDMLYNWLAVQTINNEDLGKKEIYCMLYTLKANVKKDNDRLTNHEKIEQLLTFVEEEIEIKHPRYFIIESTLMSLMQEVKDSPYAKMVLTLIESMEKIYSKQN